LNQPDDGDDRMQEKGENVAHAQDGIKLKKFKNSGRLRYSPTTRFVNHRDDVGAVVENTFRLAELEDRGDDDLSQFCPSNRCSWRPLPDWACRQHRRCSISAYRGRCGRQRSSRWGSLAPSADGVCVPRRASRAISPTPGNARSAPS